MKTWARIWNPPARVLIPGEWVKVRTYPFLCCFSQAGSDTLFPSCLELVVPLSISLSTRISRRERFQRCGIIGLVPVDNFLFGSVHVRIFSLHVR